MGFTQKAMESERKQVQLELSKAKARDRELNNLLDKLCEDNVAGKISDERFVRMSRKYEYEQAGLQKRMRELEQTSSVYAARPRPRICSSRQCANTREQRS